MAIRTRAVRPDSVLGTALGGIPHVSDEAFIRAVVDAATAVNLVGGELRIVVQRAPTEFANESVTVAALIEWKNHTEAKPQPEPHVQAPAVETVADAPGWGDEDEDLTEYEADRAAEDDVDRALPTAAA